MIKVTYQEYTNDFCKQTKEKLFYNLGEFADWFFKLCDRDYEKYISIPLPTQKVAPYRMEVNCMWTKNKCFWVHMIEREGTIIFSDGKFTSGQKHWNDEMKELCTQMEQRRKKPVFNFG